MRVLLIEPNYFKLRARTDEDLDSQTCTNAGEAVAKRARASDETLRYPPIGLLKLARFHKNRGDEIRFVSGFDKSLFKEGPLFAELWDRVYITTLFTYQFDQVVRTIQFYLEAVAGTKRKIFVGGIMASLMPNEIYNSTGIVPITGILTSPKKIHLEGRINIDLLPPDYSVLDHSLYAINDTYYAYTTRGCKNKCPWCGVPRIEPKFDDYIDIKPAIREMRKEFGDKPALRLMDNNVLASSKLDKIVDDLESLGYGKEDYTHTQPKKRRFIDFNQGLDASFFNNKTMGLLSRLNIRPMRIAFDRLKEKKHYLAALDVAQKHGFTEFSNYMLYNYRDTPKDLYERLLVNIRLNESWASKNSKASSGTIYSYPMRFAPIFDLSGYGDNKSRDIVEVPPSTKRDWKNDPAWTRRFIRNIELMKGAAHGAISPTPTLATRTIGKTFQEFVANLYMPEELLRNRNRHEKRVYPFEPKRKPGTGLVEEFRKFITKLLSKQDDRFYFFHLAVADNSTDSIKKSLASTSDKELTKWLSHYLRT